jgi:hypothetical protein
MNCSGQPINEQMARSIEAINLYCEYNRAWIEMYINCWRWMNPYAYYYTQNQNQNDTTK